MDDDEWYIYLDKAHNAAIQYARIEFQALARRVIYRLQRMPETGIYGNDFAYRTLWDEWCHEVQEGPHEPLEWAWEHSLETIFESVIDLVPDHVLDVLSMYAAWELDQTVVWEKIEAEKIDNIMRLLETLVSEVAGNRKIYHMQP